MLVFVDESGDPGRKISAGSSRYFSICLVLFRDVQVATECDSAIDSLRERLNLSPRKEFHFSKDNDELRTNFLRTVNQFDFLYCAVVLNKSKLSSPGFEVKESLYKYTVRLTFQNIEQLLSDAIVKFDKCGGRDFTKQLRNYVRKRQNEWSQTDGRRRIKKVQAENSHDNNLIQMADMVSGAVFRSYSDRKNRLVYRNLIQSKEYRVQFWPAE